MAYIYLYDPHPHPQKKGKKKDMVPQLRYWNLQHIYSCIHFNIEILHVR